MFYYIDLRSSREDRRHMADGSLSKNNKKIYLFIIIEVGSNFCTLELCASLIE